MDYELALCAQVGPEMFFFEMGSNATQVQEAKAVCAMCPLIDECREVALTEKVGLADGSSVFVLGVWGGTSEAERKEIRRKRNIV